MQGYRRNPFLMVLNRCTFPGLRPCFICGYHAAVGELYCTLKRRRAVLRTTSKLRCDTLCADSKISCFFPFLSWFTQTTKNSSRSTVATRFDVQCTIMKSGEHIHYMYILKLHINYNHRHVITVFLRFRSYYFFYSPFLHVRLLYT